MYSKAYSSISLSVCNTEIEIHQWRNDTARRRNKWREMANEKNMKTKAYHPVKARERSYENISVTPSKKTSWKRHSLFFETMRRETLKAILVVIISEKINKASEEKWLKMTWREMIFNETSIHESWEMCVNIEMSNREKIEKLA